MYILKEIVTDLSGSYNYSSNYITNNSLFDISNIKIISIIILIIYLISILYVPIKLFQINRNSKKIINELQKLNNKENNNKNDYIEL